MTQARTEHRINRVNSKSLFSPKRSSASVKNCHSLLEVVREVVVVVVADIQLAVMGGLFLLGT